MSPVTRTKVTLQTSPALECGCTAIIYHLVNHCSVTVAEPDEDDIETT